MAAKTRIMVADDWPDVRAIYEDGIATGHATFQMASPSWDSWDAGHVESCRLVAEENGAVLGWAALSRVSSRPVYAGVAEVSVYVAAKARGRGVGRLLLTELVRESERNGIWTLQAGIFPENKASIALHERCGFRIVGTREKLGQMRGTWRDVSAHGAAQQGRRHHRRESLTTLFSSAAALLNRSRSAAASSALFFQTAAMMPPRNPAPHVSCRATHARDSAASQMARGFLSLVALWTGQRARSSPGASRPCSPATSAWPCSKRFCVIAGALCARGFAFVAGCAEAAAWKEIILRTSSRPHDR